MNEVSAMSEQSAVLAASGQASLSHMEETMSHVTDAAGSINAKLAVLNEKASGRHYDYKSSRPDEPALP
jgi:methyl-accepting chemotaxis protein WspA